MVSYLNLKLSFNRPSVYLLGHGGDGTQAAGGRAAGLWKAYPEVLDALKNLYLEIEGWMEERMGDVEGEFQGGAIDVITADEVAAWKEKMSKVIGA